MQPADPEARHIEFRFQLRGRSALERGRTTGNYAGHARSFSVLPKKEKSQDSGRNTNSEPAQQNQGKRADENDLSVKLLLHGGESFRAEQRQRLNAVVADRRTPSFARQWHLLIAPRKDEQVDEGVNVTARAVGSDKKSLRKIQSSSKMG